jgi:hypothetical protein
MYFVHSYYFISNKTTHISACVCTCKGMHDCINIKYLSVFHTLHHIKCAPSTNIIGSDKTGNSSEKLREQISDSVWKREEPWIKNVRILKDRVSRVVHRM